MQRTDADADSLLPLNPLLDPPLPLDPPPLDPVSSAPKGPGRRSSLRPLDPPIGTIGVWEDHRRMPTGSRGGGIGTIGEREDSVWDVCPNGSTKERTLRGRSPGGR